MTRDLIANSLMLLNELPSPVYLKDQDGVFIYANDAFAKLMDHAKDNIPGKRADDFISALSAAKSHRSDALLTPENPENEIVTNLKKSDGSEYIILIRKRLVDLSGGKQGILGILNDISQFVLYEKELEEKHRELCRQQSKLKELAANDPLTGIFNRRAFYDKAEEMLRYAAVGDLDVGVVMFDLDKFKCLNDTYGHAAGDEVLVNFSKILTDCIRGSDIVSRLGGEEFALLLPDTDQNAVQVIAERIRVRVSKTTVIVEGQTIQYTTSVGSTMWIKNEQSIDTSLSRADRCLYKAKAAGRNISIFAETIQELEEDAVA